MKKRVQVFIAAGILAFTSCAPANEIAFINENKSFAIFHRTSERVILGHGGNVFYRPIDLYRVNFKNPGQNKYDYKDISISNESGDIELVDGYLEFTADNKIEIALSMNEDGMTKKLPINGLHKLKK
ncbi:hypothetical protein [Pontibacter populi]|uniref:DUF4369 domain-containing protein n=1 Tax=Pontibacter populi TaxID=890055 RepID=A0ABV1RXD0_9BACT